MDNFLLIKDLARLSGYSVYTLKFYLNEGLIKEAGRSPETNYRYFNQVNLTRLKKIRQLRKAGHSLREIKGMA